MNKQGNKSNPGGGIEWTHIFGPGSGYTANPMRGCQHACRWRMPDGHAAVCYAEAQKERLHGPGSFQQITFHPEVLDAIQKHRQPAGIFIDSMADLFGTGVTSEWIVRVLETVRDCPQHVFFSLTKNPTRLLQMAAGNLSSSLCYPSNLFLGISMPPTFMFGKELILQQQRAWFDKALDCLTRCAARVRWVSLEPLSWDCSNILAKYAGKLHWAVIGAASDGARTYQPEKKTLANVLNSLSGLPVFFKGNLFDSLYTTGQTTPLLGWREEFPKL